MQGYATLNKNMYQMGAVLLSVCIQFWLIKYNMLQI